MHNEKAMNKKKKQTVWKVPKMAVSIDSKTKIRTAEGKKLFKPFSKYKIEYFTQERGKLGVCNHKHKLT